MGLYKHEPKAACNNLDADCQAATAYWAAGGGDGGGVPFTHAHLVPGNCKIGGGSDKGCFRLQRYNGGESVSWLLAPKCLPNQYR